MENKHILISTHEKIIIINADLEDEKKYEGAYVFKGDYKIVFKESKND